MQARAIAQAILTTYMLTTTEHTSFVTDTILNHGSCLLFKSIAKSWTWSGLRAG